MKDWEVSGSYFLPRILYFRTRNNTLPGKLPKPNLRFYSLGEDNQWTAWKSSDYFYPEMIPEPDYSDSERDSEDEDEKKLQPSNTRSTIQRLRDFTEIYMAKVEGKKKPTQSRKAATISAAKAGPKKKAVSKDSSSKGKTSTKKSPKTSPTATRKERNKSPTGVSVQKGNSRKVKSPKVSQKSPSKTKPTSPTRQRKILTELQHSKSKPSDEEKTTKPSVKKNVADKAKISSKKSLEVDESLPTVSQPKIKSDTLPKRIDKSEPVSKGTSDTKPVSTAVKKGSGDASKKDTSITPQSSPPSEKSRTASSGISTEHSSDEEQFIKPKKPYQTSTEKLKLHKELKFTQKYGKFSSSKTELQLALERYTENKVKRELNAAEKTSLEKILELQAKKVEMQEAMAKTPSWVDRLQRGPATLPNPKTEEFYRVHARVVSNNILAHSFQPDSIQCDSASPKSLCSSGNTSDS